MKYILAAFCLALTSACANAPSEERVMVEELNEATAIIEVLLSQKDAWNSGDIDGFMDGYWRSPDLRFASGGTVTKGWQETRDRYHTNYSDRAKMGTLDFTELEVTPLASDAAIVHGRWKLTRANDAPHGLFTLVFRRVEGRWLIVSDTTTSGGN